MVVGILLLVATLPGSAGAADARADDPKAVVPPHAEAVAFAAAHHPELAELLVHLEHGDPQAFATAIADLDRTRERFAKLEQRQPERHAAALDEWKLSSRIQLVLARMALSKDPQLEAQLEELVRRRQAARLAAMRVERGRLEARLARIDAVLAEHAGDPDEMIERECRELLRKQRRPTAGKTVPRDAEAERTRADGEER